MMKNGMNKNFIFGLLFFSFLMGFYVDAEAVTIQTNDLVGEWYAYYDDTTTLTFNEDMTCQYDYHDLQFEGTWGLVETDVLDGLLIIWESRVIWNFYVEMVSTVIYLYPDLDTEKPYIFVKRD